MSGHKFLEIITIETHRYSFLGTCMHQYCQFVTYQPYMQSYVRQKELIQKFMVCVNGVYLRLLNCKIVLLKAFQPCHLIQSFIYGPCGSRTLFRSRLLFSCLFILQISHIEMFTLSLPRIQIGLSLFILFFPLNNLLVAFSYQEKTLNQQSLRKLPQEVV